jgi:hypothetical protein
MTTSKSITSVPGDFFIAGRKRVTDWRAFEPTLTPGGDPTPWKKAFKAYFHARLSYRYFKPITTLLHSGTKAGEGFSIVAIQCSLIEFLESTIQGKSYLHCRKGDPPLGKHEYKLSGGIFESFLVNRPPFNREFNPVLAHDFYENVRCGVLHEARTKNGWAILAKSKSGRVIEPNLKILCRDNFQAALLDFVEWYKRELPLRRNLQEAFLRKFNSLCT